MGYTLQQYKRELGMVGGVVVIVLGLHTAGIIKIPWLLYERRAEIRQRPVGLFGAYLVGVAFGFGWTPCIGPILGAILLYASQQETVTEGVLLLSSYSGGPRGSLHRLRPGDQPLLPRLRPAQAPHARGGGGVRAPCWWRSGSSW